jgi:asparagine synthase (glutamine-hydrolysing)
MTGIGGWLGSDGAFPPDFTAGALGARLARFDGGNPRTASAPFGAAAVAARPAEDADLYRDGGRLVAICGHVSFSDPDLASVAVREGPAKAVADAYARADADVLRFLSGPFALAILEPDAALLAIDRMGVQPLVWTVAGSRLVFGSRIDVLEAAPGVDVAPSNQSIFDYVYHHVIPGPDTIYPGVHRLLAGECLRYRQGRAEIARYWKMRFDEDRRRPFESLKSDFLDVLRTSVRQAAAGGGGRVGCFLSGGTDSSTIAGMLGSVSGEPAKTYSIGFDAAGYDEMAYARIAASHFHTQHHEYYVTPEDVVAAVPAIAAVHDQPFGNSSAIPAFYCAKLARDDGVEVMLAGDGGDELFGGNERYAKQHLYSLYSDLPHTLRKGIIEPAAFMLPEVGLVGKAQRYMRGASLPMPARYDTYNLLERFGADKVFTADFLSTVDVAAPHRRMEETYADTNAGSLINRMLAFDFKYTLADNDLPKVGRSCELAGVGVRYPMLGDDVVAFSATLAPRLKLKGTRLRYFFKEALRGFLPDAIITKTKHGFGLPFGTWVRTHPALRALALESLTDLKSRRIVREAFIDELTSRHLADHAAYYGTMVWVLMMLEQWFAQRGARAWNPSSVSPSTAVVDDRRRVGT